MGVSMDTHKGVLSGSDEAEREIARAPACADPLFDCARVREAKFEAEVKFRALVE
jgi:hypothetical protein